MIFHFMDITGRWINSPKKSKKVLTLLRYAGIIAIWLFRDKNVCVVVMNGTQGNYNCPRSARNAITLIGIN